MKVSLLLILLSVTPFLMGQETHAQKKDTVKKHSIYIEPYLFGRSITIGYSYQFLTRNHFNLKGSTGIGGILKFYNPQTALLFSIGMESSYSFNRWFSITGGLFNYFYFNYWANFTTEGKDCTGLWNCPPDRKFLIITPYIGCSFELKKWSFSPRVNVVIGENPFPLPSLMVKLKI